jgi:hypothetical protein
MSINLNGFWQSWDVVSGNTAATNEYEFWKGMVMSNGQVLNNQFDFFTYHNTTRYEWFKALQGTYPYVWDEYTFYANTNDPRIYDYYTFYKYCGEYLVQAVTPTPTPTNTPTPTPTPVGTIEYVAGSVDNIIGLPSMLYSYEGIDWYKGNNPNPNNFGAANQVEYNGSMWLAVGLGDNSLDNPEQIIYSYNSIDWYEPNDSAGLFSEIRSVIWTGSKWLVGGYGTNMLAESSNGLDWTAIQDSSSMGLGYNRISSLCYDGSNLLLAGGSSPSGWIAYSTDLGATWTDTFQTVISTNVRSIAYNGSRWVAVGAGSLDRIAYSDDGINWFPANDPPIVSSAYSVSWNGSLFLVGGDKVGSLQYLMVSTDGIDWSGTTNGSSLFDGLVYDTKWDGNYWLACSQNLKIGLSTDGLEWSGNTTFPSDTGSVYCIGSKNSPNYYPPIPQPTPTPTATNTPTPTPSPSPTASPAVEFSILTEGDDFITTEGGNVIEYQH